MAEVLASPDVAPLMTAVEVEGSSQDSLVDLTRRKGKPELLSLLFQWS